MKKFIALFLIAVLTLCCAMAQAETADATDAVLIGDWETEDGMAVMTVEKNPGGEDWDVVVTAAASHGAYIFKTTIRCGEDQNCFTYNKGKFWDAPITDSDEAPELGEAKVVGTIGTFTLTGDAENPALTWADDSRPDEAVVFGKLPVIEAADGDILGTGSGFYTQADMDEAIALINEKFSTWAGCEMHSIRYAGDDCVTAENLAWLNGLEDGSYTECIEFLSDFHTPVEDAGAWEPDTEYTDWQWWLAREEGGSWALVTWGY